MLIELRKFQVGDEVEVCDVLIKSIKFAITKSYQEYSDKFISSWLDNKTPENILNRMSQKNHYSFLAVKNDKIIGILLFDIKEEYLRLCYVHPSFIAKGVGRFMLSSLEDILLSKDKNRILLTSTIYAYDFYKDWGAKVIRWEKESTGEVNNPVMEKVL